MDSGHELTFARAGGLSAVTYKTKANFSAFHAPPVRRGIYAFVWPYIEPFLVGWKLKEGEKMHLRRFQYSGPLYAHIKPNRAHPQEVGSWYLLDTVELEVALREARHKMARDLQARGEIYRPDFEKGIGTSRPFTGNAVSFYVKDELEVFIPKIYLGRVR